MPERTSYMALAPTYQVVDAWCIKHGVKLGQVKHIQSMADLRGRSGFGLIVFDGWLPHSVSRQAEPAIGDYAMSKASSMYFPDTHDPVVRGGYIERWERKKGE